MRKLRLLTALYLLLAGITLSAQVYSVGDDPGRLKWSQIRTSNYRIVYPQGLDSLARVYAESLEAFRHPSGASAGFYPNQTYKKQQPVILHAYTANANGVVTWMPRRMDLFTVPDAYNLLAIPNPKLLAIHESRHVAQMQFGHAGKLRPFHALVGELAEGAFCGIYLSQPVMEGDAVATETALSAQGRGRSADFLEYYRAAFAAGDMRDYYRWRYSSMKRYTPDYYKAGYLLVGGTRHEYGDSLFMSRMIRDASEHPLHIRALRRTVKQTTGHGTRKSFDSIAVAYKARWQKETAARGPFMPSELVSENPRLHKEYSSLALVGNKLYGVRTSIEKPKELFVQDLETGKVSHVGAFAASASSLHWSAFSNRIYWSENTPDRRWSLAAASSIRYLDLETGKRGVLTLSGRYYHPKPSGKGELAVTEYPVEGGSAVAVLSEEDGSLLRRYPAPGHIQAVEALWLGDELYVSGISEEGMGIYQVNDGFKAVAAPQALQISRLWENGGKIMFSCDRTGVEELYALDPGDGSIEQLTSTEFGALDYQMDDEGKWLYYSSLSTAGRLIYRTSTDSLMRRTVELADKHVYEDAESLSEQDAAIPMPLNLDYEIGEPLPYRKALHPLKLHSWAPLFVNYDAVSKMSYDNIYQLAGLGATAMFQNELGTLSGIIGYEYAREHHGGYARVTYSGIYPVIEAQAYSLAGSAGAYLYSYVPVNLSSGGWKRGVIPSVRYSWTEQDKNTVAASLRAYTMRPVAQAGIYPRWGIGAEIGYSSHNDRTLAYLYGYVPGFIPQQGLKLSALVQKTSASEEPYWGRFSADYAIAFAPLDWSGIAKLAYVRNLELTLHAMDYLYKRKSRFVGGATLAARLDNLAIIPYDTRIGVQVLSDRGKTLATQLVFSVDL